MCIFPQKLRSVGSVITPQFEGSPLSKEEDQVDPRIESPNEEVVDTPKTDISKCLVYLERERKIAVEAGAKENLTAQIRYVEDIRKEIREKSHTGAVFLDGQCNSFSKQTSYTKWEGDGLFGEATCQWFFYTGADGVTQHKHSTGFVLKEDCATKFLRQVSEHPHYFYPDRYFSPAEPNHANEMDWDDYTIQQFLKNSFPFILSKAKQAVKDGRDTLQKCV